MSTTSAPFILIEGSMALPRLRPLGLLPAPFGREWALMAPGHSLRQELRALYAALLRTVCLTPADIRAFCAWEPFTEALGVSLGVSVREPLKKPLNDSLGAPLCEPPSMVGEMREPFTETPHVASCGESALHHHALRSSSIHWSMFAGGACALGGAAMLAWIGYGHTEHRRDSGTAKPGAVVSFTRATELAANASPRFFGSRPSSRELAASATSAAPARPSHSVASGSSGSLVGSPKPSSSPFNSASPLASASLSTVPAISGSKLLPGQIGKIGSYDSAPTFVATPTRITIADIAPTRSRKLLSSEVDQFDRHKLHEVERGFTSRHASHTRGVTRITAPPTTTQRTSPGPSAAGPYSPFAPARLGAEEYASATVHARAQPYEIATPARPTPPITTPATPATAETEWMNHMSQRRVTEVPEQFSR